MSSARTFVRALAPPSFGVATVQANAVNEDRYWVGPVEASSSGRRSAQHHPFVAVLADGHGSHLVSQYVADRLPRLLALGHTQETVQSALEQLDSELRAEIGDAKNFGKKKFENPILFSGSCVIAAVVTESTGLLVANLGDSRGLLILPSADGETEVGPFDAAPRGTQWTNELHTADSLTEQARLRNAHPGELDIVQCRHKIVEIDDDTGEVVSTKFGACYVKGLVQPTRSIGDFYLKDGNMAGALSEEVSLPSPPYIEVVPEVSVFPNPPPGTTLVLATDGLWDYVSAQEVVGMVRKGRNNNCSLAKTAQDLVERMMQLAAREVEDTDQSSDQAASVQQLKDLPPGPLRRSIHDDTTVIIVQL